MVLQFRAYLRIGEDSRARRRSYPTHFPRDHTVLIRALHLGHTPRRNSHWQGVFARACRHSRYAHTATRNLLREARLNYPSIRCFLDIRVQTSESSKLEPPSIEPGGTYNTPGNRKLKTPGNRKQQTGYWVEGSLATWCTPRNLM
eukprot:1852104-Pyramimonas_sp.AAC.2